MTTNQTIDGVPREPEWCEALLKLEVVREALTSRDSAERLRNMDAGKVLREGIAILKELRALLAAKPETVAGHHPACRAVDDYKPGDCSHSCKPAAQSQGEPVAKSKPVAKLHAERLTGRDGEYGITVEDSQWFNTCRLTGGEFYLYAEQPAPVAVVLPERRTQDGWQSLTSQDLGWNACLDELKRLNPSL